MKTECGFCGGPLPCLTHSQGQTTAWIDEHNRLHYAECSQPQSDEASQAYQRGWDDCLMKVFQVLGEKFPLPAALPSAADLRAANFASPHPSGEGDRP